MVSYIGVEIPQIGHQRSIWPNMRIKFVKNLIDKIFQNLVSVFPFLIIEAHAAWGRKTYEFF